MDQSYRADQAPVEALPVKKPVKAASDTLAKGRMLMAGEIEVQSLDEKVGLHTVPMAVLVTFDSADELRKAVKSGRCEFTFGDEA